MIISAQVKLVPDDFKQSQVLPVLVHLDLLDVLEPLLKGESLMTSLHVLQRLV